VAAGSDFSLSVQITGNPSPFGYVWRRGSLPVAGTTNNARSNFVTLNTAVSGFTLSNLVTYTTNVVGGTTNIVSSTNRIPTTHSMRILVFNDAHTAPGVNWPFTITVLPDADQDGIPDMIEQGLGLATNNAADATGDLDLDGMNNRDEFLAGTDPTNSLSFLKIEQSIIPGLATVQVAVVSNRTYTVQYTDALGSGGWTKLGDIVARPNNRIESFTDPAWTSNRFYQVVLPQQP
jgi:hypothetical protein